MGSYWRCVGVAGQAILPTACNAGSRDRPSWRLRPDYLFARQQRASKWPSRPTNRLLMLDYSQQRVLQLRAARAAQLSGNPIVGQWQPIIPILVPSIAWCVGCIAFDADKPCNESNCVVHYNKAALPAVLSKALKVCLDRRRSNLESVKKGSHSTGVKWL